MIEIDRMAIVIRPKAAFIQWVNDCSDGEPLSDQDVKENATLLLVPVFDNETELNQYLAASYPSILEQEFESWCLEQDKWLDIKSFDDFLTLFEVDVHEMVLDMVEGDYHIEEVTLQ